MTSWSREPETAALALMAGARDDLEIGERVLLAAGPSQLTALLQSSTRNVTRWNRRVDATAVVQPDPPAGAYTAALLRLPKSREEQVMITHQCLAALSPEGRLIVYGGNDEGIRSFQKTLGEIGTVTTLATRGHGRVLELLRRHVTITLAGRLADWRERGDAAKPWISYPGLFAGGAPDPGTLLLLAHLPALSALDKILDYGAGPGAIAAAICLKYPVTQLTLLDNDSVALVAAGENVAGATMVLGDSLDAMQSKRFDLIVSNPPLHVGFMEDTTALQRLIASAPVHLTTKGTLMMVVQRRIALDRSLAATFATVDIVADDGRYRVWRAGKGKKT